MYKNPTSPLQTEKESHPAIRARRNSGSVVSLRRSPHYSYFIVKRGIDLLFCASVVICFFWLFVALWLLVRIDSQGPALFSQMRVGKGGKLFRCYKLRTMKCGTPQTATHLVPHDAITRVGRLLRLSKLDELPQILNIFWGELTLVGPRPCLPQQEDVIAARKEYDLLDITPGITGLSQISRIDMRNPGTLAAMDAEYKSLRSTRHDLSILFRTALGKGFGDPASVALSGSRLSGCTNRICS